MSSEFIKDSKNERKKVLITASTFPRWEGDSEPRFVLDYAQALCDYYDVTVLVPASEGALSSEMMGDVHVVRFDYMPIKKHQNLCYPGSILSRLRSNRLNYLKVPFLLFAMYFELMKYSRDADIVHANWLIPQGVVQSFIKKPFIVTGHGSDVTAFNGPFSKSLKRRVIKRASAVVVVSNYLKDLTNELLPNNKTTVVSMGCDCHGFGPGFRKENYFNQNGKRVILFVGRLTEGKGVSFLISAMNKIDNAMLVIAGSGDDEGRLREIAKPVSEKVIFLGAKTHEELRTIYASSDVFVMPSITLMNGASEGFGLVALEAMASGIPVVASKSGGITDIIGDNDNGLLCEEKDSDSIALQVNRLLNDRNLYDHYVEMSLLTASSYDFKEIAKRYSQIIENALANTK